MLPSPSRSRSRPATSSARFSAPSSTWANSGSSPTFPASSPRSWRAMRGFPGWNEGHAWPSHIKRFRFRRFSPIGIPDSQHEPEERAHSGEDDTVGQEFLGSAPVRIGPGWSAGETHIGIASYESDEARKYSPEQSNAACHVRSPQPADGEADPCDGSHDDE